MALNNIDRINTVYSGGGHVVICGAGASIASTKRNQEIKGKVLPSMNNLIEVIGLNDIIKHLPENILSNNFEQLYSNLYNANPQSDEIKEIESRVSNYFADMKLPDKATIYDFLVLSLRPRDLIATFNWDPFLFQAFNRNRHVAKMPYLSFLHGSVSIGYCKEDKMAGPVGMYTRRGGGLLEPTKLLYPVNNKNYVDNEFIRTEWDRLKFWLKDSKTKRVTVFGYGAPDSDREAINIMKMAWGIGNNRDIEQFEIIDVCPEEIGIKRWEGFINSNHYDYVDNYFNSSLAINPRRTFESYHQHNFPLSEDEAFSESNPIPSSIESLEELWDWHKPLIEAERIKFQNK